MVVWTRRQAIKHAETRAIVQSLVGADEEKKADAFDDYGKKLYPFLDAYKKKKEEEQKEELDRWTRSGPLAMKSLQDLTPKKTRRRAISAEEAAERMRAPTTNPLAGSRSRPLSNIVGGTTRGRVPRSARRAQRRGTGK